MVVGTNIFNEIRAKSKWVAEQATHITIEEAVIQQFANELDVQAIGKPPLDDVAHYLDQGADTLAFFLVLESINFGSGYFPHLDNKLEGSGYFTIATYLTQHFQRNGAFTPYRLTKVTPDDCASLFKQNPENEIAYELMQLFAQSLNQLGVYVCEQFDSKFEQLILAANHSAERFIQFLLSIPSFQDIAIYKGQTIPFLKRAQIAVADTSLAFENKEWGHFKDLDQLTIFADNMMPHVLRRYGILTYSESLAHQIDHQQLIIAGSEEEIELRACAVHSVELIKARLQQLGHDLRALDIDYLLWNQGADSLTQSTHPLHLTRTIYY